MQRRDRDGKFATGPVTPPTVSDLRPATPAGDAGAAAPSDSVDAAYSAFAEKQERDEERMRTARARGIITPVSCRRCSGTGMVSARRTHYNVPGLCFRCDGLGLEEGDPEQVKVNRAAAREAKRRADEEWRVRQAAFSKMNEDLPRMRFGHEEETPSVYTVQGGIGALEVLEPERLSAALRSICAGHPDVYKSLHDYFFATADEMQARRERRFR